ncbi:hypothetical protein [Cohnella hongkongensis]|uniref:Uncharacterized protein n=1 Tax=Cohnella hongkongensis TaxID=178337 RepID=A0ABV9FM33_9BACL
MKRYILSMALGVFAVGSIGSYYASGTEGDAPRYQLVTLEGDAEQAASMRISGAYVGGVGSKALQLTVEGTEYDLTQSFYDKYLKDRSYLTRQFEDMREIKREHRDFMRARHNVNSFYRDSEWLIYADAALYGPHSAHDRKLELRLDLLEEATGRVTKHRVMLEGKPLNWIQVEDVQRIGDEVHLLARIQLRSDTAAEAATEELRDYVVDLRSAVLLRENALASEKLESMAGTRASGAAQQTLNEIRLSAISSEVRSRPSEYVVLQTLRSVSTAEEGGGERTTRLLRHEIYSYSTGTRTPLPEPPEAYASYPTSQGELGEERFTMLYSGSESLALTSFTLSTGTQEPGGWTLTAEQLGGQAIKSARLAQNRVYALIQTGSSGDQVGIADGRQLAAVVIDAANGSVLYKGQAEYAGPAEKAEQFRKNLWLTNIDVKNRQ